KRPTNLRNSPLTVQSDPILQSRGTGVAGPVCPGAAESWPRAGGRRRSLGRDPSQSAHGSVLAPTEVSSLFRESDDAQGPVADLFEVRDGVQKRQLDDDAFPGVLQLLRVT